MAEINNESTLLHAEKQATTPEISGRESGTSTCALVIRGQKSRESALAANVMKRRRPGQLLIDSEAKYRRLFEAAQDGILILNAKTGVIVDVNPFLVKLLDYPRDYFLGKALWEIGLFSDIEASRKTFQELKSKRYVRYEDLPLKNKDGRAINVEFVSNIYGVKSKQVIQCNIRDITARKEIEQLGRRLLQAQKMEAVGQLAAGVAHDFNSLLHVILGYTEILQQQGDLSQPNREIVAKIQSAGISAKSLTHRLLAFSREQVLKPVLMDLNEAVTCIQALLGGMIGADIELESLLGHDLGAIEADPHQVEQVLMNLAINARDAMPKGGKIIFETANVEIEDTHASPHVHMTSGRYVMLTVRDTGTGMDSETQAHAFEPFFTTKPTDKGTGLGLSTVSSIVKQSGGTISVSSERDHGTTFRVHFPRRDEEPMPLKHEKTESSGGGTETILLVDDAPSLRILLRIFLEYRGYTVLDSGDPAEALRMARDYEGPLPLMITDVNMPGFNGHVLAERLALERPETRVLYTSGVPDDADARHDAVGRDYAFLEKPFSNDELVVKIREILDSPKRLAARHTVSRLVATGEHLEARADREERKIRNILQEPNVNYLVSH
jgi:two-component system, cell cycle sensor histidine kinase and response regulator CckA